MSREGGRDDVDTLASRARVDADARAALVERVLPLVRRDARRYVGDGVSLEDLEQEAIVGALRAIASFDPSKGPFLPWMRTWTRHALQRAVAEQARPVRLPTHVLWELHEFRQARGRLERSLGRSPTLMEVADHLGWSLDRLLDVSRVIEPAESFEDRYAATRLGGDDDGFEDVVMRLTARQIEPVLTRLTEREREVLAARARGESLRDLGRRLGLSQERVRQIEQRALARTRQALRIPS
jgi:RNA polymerase sigma factor (sigma-70 family)